MLNKFIFSGVVEAIDEKEGFIAFSVPTPNAGNMLMNMKFDDKIVEQVSKAPDDINQLITVEGFIIPGKEKPIDLIVTTVSVTGIPNKVLNKA